MARPLVPAGCAVAANTAVIFARGGLFPQFSAGEGNQDL